MQTREKKKVGKGGLLLITQQRVRGKQKRESTGSGRVLADGNEKSTPSKRHDFLSLQRKEGILRFNWASSSFGT